MNLSGKKTHIFTWLTVAWGVFYALNRSNNWVQIDDAANVAILAALGGGAVSSLRQGVASAAATKRTDADGH